MALEQAEPDEVRKYALVRSYGGAERVGRTGIAK
jgi:hypothetical protein